MNSVPCRHCGWLVLRYSSCFIPISLANLIKILKVILIRIGDVMFHGVPCPWSGVLKNVHHHLHHWQKLLCLRCWPLGKALGREEFITIVIQFEKWKVKVLVSQSCLTLWPHGLWPTRLLCPWNSLGKNNGVGSHSLLQGIFLTQGSNLGLLHCRFFTIWAIREYSMKLFANIYIYITI